MILYPQLSHAAAEHLAAERRRLDVSAAAALVAHDHAATVFTPTGGVRASSPELRTLRLALVAVAERLGYPDGGDETARLLFDREAAAILHATMQLAPAESSKPGVWEFITCVLLPDLVRWRFPGGPEGTPVERFLSGRRNAFQRLWWRAFVLHDEQHGDPYELLSTLGEDEIVQIMERPFLAGSRGLSRTVARELLQAAERHKKVNRRTLIREAQKRFRRLAAFTSFDAVDEDALGPFVRSIFDQVATALPMASQATTVIS